MASILLKVLKNWKTTAAAVGLALIELGKLLTGDTDVNWESILLVFGLLAAGDGKD